EERELIVSGKHTNAELSEILNRTVRSIVCVRSNYKKGTSIGIRHTWMPEDIELLKNSEISVKEISVKLNITETAVRKKSSQYGFTRGLNTSHPRLEQCHIDYILEEYVKSTNIQELAEELDVTDNTIRYHLRKAGVLEHPRVKWEIKRKQVIEMFEKGHTREEVVLAFEPLGVPRPTVYNYLRSAGYTFKHSRLINYAESDISDVFKLKEAGFSLRQISSIVELDYNHVINIVYKRKGRK
ncbi:MAG: helix-turn-helix domain-containing protein, partial [Fusobacteriaceae bacterium]